MIENRRILCSVILVSIAFLLPTHAFAEPSESLKSGCEAYAPLVKESKWLGMLILRVKECSPFFAVGLRDKDLIRRFNFIQVRNQEESIVLMRLLYIHVGEPLNLEVLRAGNVITLTRNWPVPTPQQ